jgi:S-adenosylmethionine-diacylgycerolhomoserine-N-methlytransferase
MNQAQMMDRIYRYQRYVYNATRRFFLFGRNRLIIGMKIRDRDRVLEIGCGTARNLIILARRHPNAFFYGIDASSQMLKTAEAHIRKANLAGKIILQQSLAEELDHASTFSLQEPFDIIFFSYSLSMMSDSIRAFNIAKRNLKAGQTMYFVDFWDQHGLPIFFRKLFRMWLQIFHVAHKPELLEHLHKISDNNLGELSFKSMYRGYSFIASFRKT